MKVSFYSFALKIKSVLCVQVLIISFYFLLQQLCILQTLGRDQEVTMAVSKLKSSHCIENFRTGWGREVGGSGPLGLCLKVTEVTVQRYMCLTNGGQRIRASGHLVESYRSYHTVQSTTDWRRRDGGLGPLGL